MVTRLQSRLSLALSVCAVVLSSADGSTNYVSPSGHHVWPFATWLDAATNIQDAIDAANDGDTVLVTNGVYAISRQIALVKGGVVRSVNGWAKTVVNANNDCRCVHIDATNALISGFTLKGGYAARSTPRAGFGGGVHCVAGKVVDCHIVSNRAYHGGGMWCVSGMVENCQFTGNVALQSGGGVVSESALIRQCAVRQNIAGDCGGINCFASGVVERCVISENSAIADGFGVGGIAGGIGCTDGGEARHCIITRNKAILSDTGHPEGGGAVVAWDGKLLGCMVVENTSHGIAGGIACWPRGAVRNCTVVGNLALDRCGGVNWYSDSIIDNCVVWDNAAPSFDDVEPTVPCSNITYVCTTVSVSGTGNITNDPQLTPSYRLRSTSPCIDAGTASNAPATDIDGEARWDHPGHSNVVSIVDIGADEFVDSDLDDMADRWEIETFGGMTNRNGTADDDGDLLNDLGEHDNSTDPSDPDCDNDALLDGAEITHGTDPLDADTDDDKMPDGWEVTCGLNALTNDASLDPDGDRVANLGEYGADTHPMNADSVLAIENVARQRGGLRIDWKGGRQAWQFLECRPSLTTGDAWTAILAIPPPTPLTNAIIDFGGSEQTVFYRVRAER